MNIYSRDKNLFIEGVTDFDIEDILECGQCFHFTKLGEKEYELLAFGRYLHIKQEANNIIMFDTTYDEYQGVWKSYFDMDKDYGIIKEHIVAADERLKHIVSDKSGIRILKQDFFETLISFIISQNKQIPHIKQIVHTISERFGQSITLSAGRIYHAFPDVHMLSKVSEEELRQCKVGFRAPYIMDAVNRVNSGEISEELLRHMTYEEAKERLLSIKGVGEKVANCVLLFGLGFTNAFPVDVWMKRIMEYMYFEQDTKKDVIEAFAYDKFGEYSGYAQQYLFCYGREKGLGK